MSGICTNTLNCANDGYPNPNNCTQCLCPAEWTGADCTDIPIGTQGKKSCFMHIFHHKSTLLNTQMDKFLIILLQIIHKYIYMNIVCFQFEITSMSYNTKQKQFYV